MRDATSPEHSKPFARLLLQPLLLSSNQFVGCGCERTARLFLVREVLLNRHWPLRSASCGIELKLLRSDSLVLNLVVTAEGLRFKEAQQSWQQSGSPRRSLSAPNLLRLAC
jgi:hypothetical protein